MSKTGINPFRSKIGDDKQKLDFYSWLGHSRAAWHSWSHFGARFINMGVMKVWDFGPWTESSLSWATKVNVTKKHGLGLFTLARAHLGGAHHPVARTEASLPGHRGMGLPRDRCALGSVLRAAHIPYRSCRTSWWTSASESDWRISQQALVSGSCWVFILDQCA